MFERFVGVIRVPLSLVERPRVPCVFPEHSGVCKCVPAPPGVFLPVPVIVRPVFNRIAVLTQAHRE